MPYGRILKDFDIETGQSGVDQREVERKNGIILILMKKSCMATCGSFFACLIIKLDRKKHKIRNKKAQNQK